MFFLLVILHSSDSADYLCEVFSKVEIHEINLKLASSRKKEVKFDVVVALLLKIKLVFRITLYSEFHCLLLDFQRCK